MVREDPHPSHQELGAVVHDGLRVLTTTGIESGPAVGVDGGLSVVLDELRRPFDVLGCQGVFDGLFDEALGFEPLHSPEVQPSDLIRSRGLLQLSLQKLLEEMVIAVRLAVCVEGDGKEILGLNDVEKTSTGETLGC